MNTDVREELRQFSVRLLERRGGMVEWPGADQIGEAIVPADVAAAFGAQGEFVTLACTPGGAVVGVSLANDFLDAAARVLDAEPRVADFSAADLYLKRKDIDAALAKTFTWLNAKVRIQGACEAREEYHFWWFHAVVRSEDRWETRFHVAINSQCGTALALPDPMGLWELRPSPDESRRPPSATFPFAAAAARREVLRLAEPFLLRMDDRRQRDRRRLESYYQALLDEQASRRGRAGAPLDPAQIAARRKAVDLELRRKLMELDQRYAIDVELRGVALVRLALPVLRVDLCVVRKQDRRLHRVYWNPLLKAFEPIACGQCGEGVFAVVFTNGSVEPRCVACGK